MMKAIESWWFEFIFYPWMGVAVWVGLLAILGVLVYRGTTIDVCNRHGRNGHHARLNVWSSKRRKEGEP